MSLSKENKVIIDGQTYYGGLNQPNLKFIKVNVDCWEKIFDFLALRDILAMSQTCQRMRQIGGYYFRENFYGTPCSLRESSSPSFYLNGSWFELESGDFLRFTDTINVFNNLEYFRKISSMDVLKSLTTLKLCFIDEHLNEHRLQGLENIQANIETIELNNCYIGDDSLGDFLASCPKLKCLRFEWVHFESEEFRTNLYERTYPKLEHFQLSYYFRLSFLARNPSIKTLCISPDDLCRIPLDASTIHLDCLKVQIWSDDKYTDELVNRIKTFHMNGLYKTLHALLCCESTPYFINEMVSFCALEVLYAKKSFPNICHLTGLKELGLWSGVPEDLEPIAINLINLERLCIGGTADHLLPFLRYSKKLKFVIFNHKNNTGEALDLYDLNEVRKICEVEHKVRIGVDEKIYLATKWMIKNVNYKNSVEIVRVETIQGQFAFQ